MLACFSHQREPWSVLEADLSQSGLQCPSDLPASPISLWQKKTVALDLTRKTCFSWVFDLELVTSLIWILFDSKILTPRCFSALSLLRDFATAPIQNDLP